MVRFSFKTFRVEKLEKIAENELQMPDHIISSLSKYHRIRCTSDFPFNKR